MKYWWVNQNQTYKHEVPGGFLWSPKTRADGGRNQFYDFMTQVEPGDVVFSFSDTYIKAIGRIAGRAKDAPKPDFGGLNTTWGNEGWLVPVEFLEFSNPIRPKDHIQVLRQHLPEKYSPLQSDGNGLQGVYLTEVPQGLAAALIKLIGQDYDKSLAELREEARAQADQENDEQAETSLAGRTDIGATEKDQLVKARRGQGIFKANVRLNETKCRVTGVSHVRHLIASHIKPWRECNDIEKLDGCNGLLLAPHVDHLFDRGYISFEDDGRLLISPKLNGEVLKKWGIDQSLVVGPFNPRQAEFLQYHRTVRFKRI